MHKVIRILSQPSLEPFLVFLVKCSDTVATDQDTEEPLALVLLCQISAILLFARPQPTSLMVSLTSRYPIGPLKWVANPKMHTRNLVGAFSKPRIPLQRSLI